MRSIFLFQVASTILVEAADPCPRVCDLIPGACGADGSRCVGEFCTDLYWTSERALCNSSFPNFAVQDRVYCTEAEVIVFTENVEEISAAGVKAGDACSQICDEMPGACGVDGSRCVGEFCSDVFWRTGSTLCNSATPNCPLGNPLSCGDADQVMAQEGHFGVSAFTGDAPDPCMQLCDAVAGACDGVDTACIAETFCANIYWFTYGFVLCNASQRDCDGARLLPVSCTRAGIIASTQNLDGVIVYDPLFPAGSYEEEKAEAEDPRGDEEVVHDFPFAPRPEAHGRRGFSNIDDTTSNLASVLQILLHSHAIRRAIMNEIEFEWSPFFRPMDDAVFSTLYSLLNQMYGPRNEEALDLTEFRFALLEAQTEDPIQLLRFILEKIARVSRPVNRAVTVERTLARFCLECFYLDPAHEPVQQVVQLVPFPDSTPPRARWSIKDMLAPHLSEELADERVVCPGCEQVGDYRQNVRTALPDLLTIGIDRRPDGSAERVNSYVETPMEIDFAGIVEGGEMYGYRLVGIVREINGKYVADYFDSDSGEWIHANDTHLHVIQGQPRNGGTDAVVVVYQSI